MTKRPALNLRGLPECILALLIAFLAFNGAGLSPAYGQPQPTHRPTPEGLKPKLRLVDVALNNGPPKPVNRLGPLPTAVPEFFLPRNPLAAGAFVLEVHTTGGRGTIAFSHILPSDVQGNAFQWVQSSGQPSAIGRLRYNFCNACPATFTLEISAKDKMDFSGAAPKAQIRIHLTASRGPARVLGVDTVVADELRPQFRIAFTPGTFDLADSQAVAQYSDGFKYRLIPQDPTAGTMVVVIERLKVTRNVTVRLSNPLGGSNIAVSLPGQHLENNPFECLNCSTCWACGGVDRVPIDDTVSVQHPALSGLTQSGTDPLPIRPMLKHPAGCDEVDHLFTTARVTIVEPKGLTNPPKGGPGKVRITTHPPTNQPLREPGNVIRVYWEKPGLVGDWWYQVAASGVDVVGTCSERVVRDQ